MASNASSGSAGRHLGLDPVECLWQQAKSTALRFNYSATPGPTVSLAPDHSASGIFCHCFTDDVWDLLTTETNRHAATIVSRTCSLVISIGIVKLPRLELYWSTKHSHISTLGISSVMSLVRFEHLFRCLHLIDNANQIYFGSSGHDHLFKG